MEKPAGFAGHFYESLPFFLTKVHKFFYKSLFYIGLVPKNGILALGPYIYLDSYLYKYAEKIPKK